MSTNPHVDEPAAPARGQTIAERGRDVSEAQAAAEAHQSTWARMLAAASPRFLWSMAEGYPVVLKQFIQFCLVIIYPAWVFAVVVGMVAYAAVYFPLWLLFWPVRAWMKKNRPEDYAASQAR
jgi:hypothetical protein